MVVGGNTLATPPTMMVREKPAQGAKPPWRKLKPVLVTDQEMDARSARMSMEAHNAVTAVL